MHWNSPVRFNSFLHSSPFGFPQTTKPKRGVNAGLPSWYSIYIMVHTLSSVV